MRTKKKYHCKFCGGVEIQHKVRSNSGLTSKKVVDPQVEVSSPQTAGFSFKVKLFSWSKGKNKELLYETTYCKTCRNIDVIDKNIDTFPMELISNQHTSSVVIPFVLQRQLQNNCYEPNEISDLVNGMRKKLEKIYKSWSKDGGTNICKCSRVGKKIKISLKTGIKTICYVIVDAVESRIVFRLSYGGRDVNCD